MLYNEVKAEQHFSTLMNATVSHDIRNPLYGLVGGIDALKSYLANLLQLIKSFDISDLNQNELVIQIQSKLKLIHSGIDINVTKMSNCV